MASVYPGSLDSFTTHSAGQTITSADINKIQDAALAIETTLGTNLANVPAGASVPPPSANTLKAWTWDPVIQTSGTNTITAGTLQVSQLYAASALSLTKAYIYTLTNPTTPTHCFAAFYNSAGSLLATSADIVGTFPGTGLKTFTFSSTAVSAGLFYVGWWMSAAAGCDTAALNNTANQFATALLGSSSYRFATANTGLTTTAPATIGTRTAVNLPIWVAVA